MVGYDAPHAEWRQRELRAMDIRQCIFGCECEADDAPHLLSCLRPLDDLAMARSGGRGFLEGDPLLRWGILDPGNIRRSKDRVPIHELEDAAKGARKLKTACGANARGESTPHGSDSGHGAAAGPAASEISGITAFFEAWPALPFPPDSASNADGHAERDVFDAAADNASVDYHKYLNPTEADIQMMDGNHDEAHTVELAALEDEIVRFENCTMTDDEFDYRFGDLGPAFGVDDDDAPDVDICHLSDYLANFAKAASIAADGAQDSDCEVDSIAALAGLGGPGVLDDYFVTTSQLGTETVQCDTQGRTDLDQSCNAVLAALPTALVAPIVRAPTALSDAEINETMVAFPAFVAQVQGGTVGVQQPAAVQLDDSKGGSRADRNGPLAPSHGALRGGSLSAPRIAREEEAAARAPQSARERLPAAAPPASPRPPLSGRASSRNRMRATQGDAGERCVVPPAAPGTPAPAKVDAWKETIEVQRLNQQLLEAIFESALTEEASLTIADTYPELLWLANCLKRCPLPPCWSSADGGAAGMRYFEIETTGQEDGERKEGTHPLLGAFSELGRLMMEWRRKPSLAGTVAEKMESKKEEFLEEAGRSRFAWEGPFTDPATSAQFWHCRATARSTWGDPAMVWRFLAKVAEGFVSALPARAASGGEAQAAPAAPAAGSAGAPGAEGPAAEFQAARAAASRAAGAAAAAANAMAALGPRGPAESEPAGAAGLRAASPAPSPPAAARGEGPCPPSARRAGSSARPTPRRIQILHEIEDAARGEMGERVRPGDELSTEAPAELQVRREFRRRREESRERLEPLGPATPRAALEAEEPPAEAQGLPVAAMDRLQRAKPPSTPREEKLAPIFAEPSAQAKPPSTPREQLAPISAAPGAQAKPPSTPREEEPAPSVAEHGAQASTAAEQPAPSSDAQAPQPSARPPSSGRCRPPSAHAARGDPPKAARRALPRPGVDTGPELDGAAAGPRPGSRPGSARRRPSTPGRQGSRPSSASSRPGTAGGPGSTWMAGQMCLGAVQAAIDDACQSEGEDASRVEDDESLSWEGQDSFDAGRASSPAGAGVRFREGHSVCSEPCSPSLMSVLGRSALFSPRRGTKNSPAPDSPSLIICEGAPPLWTDHKALPPRSPRTPREEKPVLLGVPQPLSARGRERCVESAPLSARYKKRPAGCVGSSSKFGGA
ncbi:unnamed protein product [Prorocentrum cordatum]|uniref:WW domain-containing protein n=1 Tax=Prorocentrum cordatum TaxID=2364126 RepID=A0ABN9U7N6_9DINO|nr:unnamed protein product [Polarella glacialis]